VVIDARRAGGLARPATENSGPDGAASATRPGDRRCSYWYMVCRCYSFVLVAVISIEREKCGPKSCLVFGPARFDRVIVWSSRKGLRGRKLIRNKGLMRVK
jgi:hypothetical protein